MDQKIDFFLVLKNNKFISNNRFFKKFNNI